MKSNTIQLENRGFVIKGVENNYLNTSFEQRIGLIKSNLATDRTLGARLLARSAKVLSIDYLIEALILEQKLYSKIEICNSLVSFGKEAVIPLIALIGKIRNKQYLEIPAVDFKKVNYPLPRDIASRTLIRIGSIALPDLLNFLNCNDQTRISEAIDAIGFICFYENQPEVYKELKNCFYHNSENDLIKWKIFRAMSAFAESESFLNEQKQQLLSERIKSEIERSLLLIKKRT